MSITEIPLVATYHSALLEALQQHSVTRSADDSDVIVNIFRKAKDEYGINDSGPAHDSAVENVIRDKFIELVSSLDIHQPEFQQVWDLIDLANTLSEHEMSEPSLAFYLIEELLDSQTIDGCRLVFDYLESRREQMVRKNFKTKSLVILRCCNELLRRLSRAEETVFCGRVFIYLFQTFPLGDRSSVNLRGVFHTENTTTFEETTTKSVDAIQPMEIDNETPSQIISRAATPSSFAPDAETKTSRSTPSIKASKLEPKVESPPDLDMLYPIFWSLQSLFSDPTKLFNAHSMQQFKDGIASTLSCFRYVSKHSAPTMESLDIKRGLKRKRDESSQEQNANAASKYNPKYLTSRDLFDLEVHDMAFRRHFLVQGLIMLDFLLSLSPAAKARTVGSTNRSVLYTYTLSEDDIKWADDTRASIRDYVQQSGIGSEGNLYYRMVDTVLSRDKNWARWKAENCPPISRPPISPETYLASQKSLKELSKIPTLVNPPGSSDFNFLSQIEPLESLKNPSQRTKIPTLPEYYKAIQGDDLDLEMAMDDTEKAELEEKKAGRLWRALRSANGKRFVICEQIKNGENLGALINEGNEEKDEEKINGEVDSDGEDEGPGPGPGPGPEDGGEENISKIARSVQGEKDEENQQGEDNQQGGLDGSSANEISADVIMTTETVVEGEIERVDHLEEEEITSPVNATGDENEVSLADQQADQVAEESVSEPQPDTMNEGAEAEEEEEDEGEA